jgi:hypothetical protein
MRRASIATIIRIPYVHTLGDEQDFLYATTDVAIWSCSETGLAITAACGAILRPLFREVLASGRHVSSRAMSRGKNHSNTFNSSTKKRIPTIRNSHRRTSPGDGAGDEVPLRPLDQHGGGSFRGHHDIGISTKAWHSDKEVRKLYLGRQVPDAEIVVTKTQNVAFE